MSTFFSRRADGTASPVAVWAALLIVYVVWGSTYLAIRVVDETMPPMLAAAARFIAAGAVLYAWMLLRHGRAGVRVSARELAASVAVGAALLVGGNGLLMIAEKHVASGLASLLIASEPIWIVALRLVARERVSRLTVAGLVVGLAGVAVLVLPGGASDRTAMAGLAMLIGAAGSWALGSYFSARVPLPGHPLLSTATQMLTGGVLMAILGLARGEGSALDPSAFSASSIAGLVYLIVFGSLVAFTAYVWLLQNAPISHVSTYAYVNPVIAIFLGWALAGESVTLGILAGAAIIVGSVALIVREEGKSQPEVSEEAAEPRAHAPAPVEVCEGSPAA